MPLEPGRVRMYSCGPTVYAPAHIGNFRSFVFADLLRRYLAWKGFAVTWVMNVTDVDDKIIRDAGREGVPIAELTARHEKAFLDDCRRLRITSPDVMPRATEHIPDMAALVTTLLEGACIPHGRRLDLLPNRQLAGLRPTGACRPDAATRRRARRGRRVQQGRRPGLRAVEGGQGREPSWSTEVGGGGRGGTSSARR